MRFSPPRFNQLRTKLTVLYAGLFGGVLLALAATVQIAVSNNAASVVRSELTANGAVFDRIWTLRANQLRESADILSRDFGFRDAVSTHDAATIRSALDNLRQRVGIDRAFMMDMNGEIIGLDVALPQDEVGQLWQALDEKPGASGVLKIDGAPHQAVSAPIRAPDVIGWIVFAAKLDRAQMTSFEDMAAIPLEAGVFQRGADGAWRSADTQLNAHDTAVYARFLSHAVEGGKATPETLRTSAGEAVALVRPLDRLSGDNEAPAVLLLRYPLAKAMAPYSLLLGLMAAIGVGGLALAVYGAWALSRSLTRPITALDEAALRLQNGEEAHVAVQSEDEIGRLAHSFNTMATHIREREKRISHMARHDSETDLANRRAIEELIAARIQRGDPGAFAAVAIGIDRYRHVRGAIGYELAAHLVRALGARLSSHRGGEVARLSANMLGVVIEGEDADAVMRTANALAPMLESPIRLGGVAIDVTVTVGLAIWSPGQSPGTLVNHASIAIDQAREAHRKVAAFNAAAYGDPAKNLSLISEIFDGIAAGDVTLHHQPKFDIRAGKITGAEVLTRWRHPSRGMIPPDLFIGMAEETGHIHALTDWALRQAIDDQARLRAAGHDLPLSVNISGRLLSDESFAETSLAMVEQARARLCFEITETAVIDDPEIALRVVDRFANAGVTVSIDDYGSGLSSLAYLKKIRAEELKIDKAFVMSATDSQRDALLVKSTIDLAHGLGMKVTAEGVETPAALALLSGMGCDRAQGYLIGRPAPLATLLEALELADERPWEQAGQKKTG